MAEPEWSWTLHEYIPSSLDEGHRVMDEFVSALNKNGWDGRELFHVQMAAEEAMVNAVTHGNHESPDKRVEIELKLNASSVEMRFCDEGDGFNPADLPDPREDEHLESTNGRGVMLILEMMDYAQYSDKGNEVIMRKSRACKA